MSEVVAKQRSWISRNWTTATVQYSAAAVAVWVALSLWTFSPLLHRHPFALFLVAVLFSARFLGFGPSVFCSLLSAACLDFFVFPPVLTFGLANGADRERLLVFLGISVFAASMAWQKKQAESRADRIRREMAAIVEYSPDAIFSTNPEGDITSWNRAAELLYGYTVEEAVGMPVRSLAPMDRQTEVENNVRTLKAGGQVAPYQTERMRKDGTSWPVMLSISPLQNAQGEILGASAIARDMSAEKVSEEAVRRSEKLASAGRMAASIAHEINNPLEAVVNLLYLARHDSKNAPQYLTMAEKEVGRVASLAQQTLGFVRDSSSPGSIDAATLMDEVLQLYSHKLETRTIRVARRYRPAQAVHGFGGELRQLFANMVVNAADAMAREGLLQVRIAPNYDWRSGSQGIRITVADTGSGIPPESIGRIFEPFYTTKKDTGTGLGLWVSSGIVRKHGGRIRVRSWARGPRTGTVFSIFLPYRYEISRVA